MPVIAPDLSRAFIEGVKLPAAPRAQARAVTDTPPLELKAIEAQSVVVGSGLIVAAENVPQQTREDLVNCTLFAQLAASGAVTDVGALSGCHRPDRSRWIAAGGAGGLRARGESDADASALREVCLQLHTAQVLGRQSDNLRGGPQGSARSHRRAARRVPDRLCGASHSATSATSAWRGSSIRPPRECRTG